jgi:hypothetical protein
MAPKKRRRGAERRARECRAVSDRTVKKVFGADESGIEAAR